MFKFITALLLLSGLASAATTTTVGEKLLLGKKGSSVDITLEANTNSANKPKLKYDKGSSKWIFSNDGTTLKDFGSGSGGGGGGINLLSTDDNAGFEDGTTGWTASGGSFTIESSTPLFGDKSALFDASALNQTLSSTAKSIKEGLKGQACLAAISYQFTGALGDYKLQVYNGSIVLGEQSLTPAVSTDVGLGFVGFQCPISGTVLVRVIAGVSNPAVIKIDGSYLNGGLVQLGSNLQIGQIANAEFYGSVITPGGNTCVWSSTTNQTFGSYPADTNCATPTVKGKALAPSTKIPAIRLDNLPAGEYDIYAIGDINANTSSCSYIFSDGTQQTSPGVSQVTNIFPNIRGHLSYSSAGNRVIEIQATGTTGSSQCDIYNGTANTVALEIGIYKYPTTAQTSYATTSQSAAIYQGKITGCTGSTDITSGTFVDVPSQSGCTITDITNQNFGSVSTGAIGFPITWTPKRAGSVYEACVTYSAQDTGNGFQNRIVDETNAELIKSTLVSGGGVFREMQMCAVWKSISLTPKTFRIQGYSLAANDHSFNADVVTWRIRDISNSEPTTYLVSQNTKGVTGYVDGCTGTNTVTQTTYAADFPSQTGCTWHDTVNANFGTVTAAAVGFGPTWTPSEPGLYEVTTNFSMATSSTDVQARIVDQSNQLVQDLAPVSCVGQFCSFTFGGLYQAVSTSPVTFKLQGKSSAGTVTLRPELQTWSIKRLP